MNDADYKKRIGDEAEERFNSFKNSVEEKGFFLGFCRKDGVKHLVLALADPRRKNKQMVAFIFPFLPDNSFRQYSLAPSGLNELLIEPLSTNIRLYATVDSTLELFKKAAALFKTPLSCSL